MTERADQIEALRQSEDRFAARLAGLSDPALRQPSRLPDWSVAHVVAHVAANADSVTRRLRGLLDDLVVDQYPGGAAGRAAEIDARAGQGADDLRADLAGAVAAMFAVIGAVPDPVWKRLSRKVSGVQVDGDALLAGRWQEVEIHHVDLGLGYETTDWPADFVAARLPHLLGSAIGRTDSGMLLAWITGRGPAPVLGPW